MSKHTRKSLELKYLKLKKEFGRVPIRQEMSYTMRLSKKFGRWCDFVKSMGDIPVRNTYTREELKKIILDYDKEFGRPPSSDEMKRPNSRVFQNEFGTWNDALIACGFKVSHPMYIANDGHKCYSRMELYVDNWLTKQGIKHDKDVYYPQHKTLNKNHKKTCDWVTSDGQFIELFGLMRKIEYREKVKQKEELCEIFNINLVKLFPSDLNKLNQRITFL